MTGGMVSRALGALVLVLVTLLLVGGSRRPYRLPGSAQAVLRLSWSGRPERIERCRRLSVEELEARPIHMRREVECEGRPARYLVRVTDDGNVLLADTVTGGGIRGDRAIHMLRELTMPAGGRQLAVEITRVDVVTPTGDSTAAPARGEELWRPGLEDRERREEAERQRQRLDRLPPELRWQEEVTLGEGEVVLVSYDPATRRLVARTGAGAARRSPRTDTSAAPRARSTR